MGNVDDLDRDFAAFRRTGDAAALARVFDSAAPRLLLVASHWTKDAASAEDLVQVAFLEAVRDAGQWDEQRPVLRWLASIVAHRALDRRRRQRNEPTTNESAFDDLAAPTPTPLAGAIEREELDRIMQALARLEPPYHEVLVLRLVHGLQPTAIAHALGRAPATVRKQLERGLQQLRGLLPAAFVGAFALLLPERGLAAMRAHVLASAAPTATIPIGVLAMKKVLATLLLLLVLTLLGWQLLPDATASPAPSPLAAAPIAVATTTPAADRTPREAPPATTSALARNVAGLESSLVVRVVHEVDRRPVVGTTVQVVPQDGTDERLGRRFASTDANGEATFARLPAGQLTAMLPMRSVATTFSIALAAGERREHTVTVASLRLLAGCVLAPDGTPVAGAQLRVRPCVGIAERNPDHVVTTSREDGTFELEVGAEVVQLAASHRDYARSEAVHVHEGLPDEPLRLVLRAGPARLLGEVRSDAGPVADAQLAVAPPRDGRRDGALFRSDGGHAYARSGGDGRFAIDGLPANGTATITVLARGMAPFTTKVALVNGDQELTFVLQPAPVVTGRVLDRDGLPLDGAIVRSGDAIARCGSEGRFRLDTLPPGPASLRASGLPTFAGAQREVLLVAGEATAIDFVLAPLAALTGRVVDEAGRPLADLQVSAFRAEFGPDFFRADVDAEGRLDDVHERSAISDGEGGFSIFVVPGASSVLVVQQPRQWFATGVVELGPFVAPRQDLVLTVPAAGLASGYLRGRMLEANGRPLAGATLQLGDGQRLATVGRNVGGPLRLPADGTFTIGPLPARRYTLQVSAGGDAAKFTTAAFDVAAGTTTELGDVLAPQHATLTLRLRGEAELPSRPLLQCERADGSYEVHPFDQCWQTTVKLVPGDYTVTVYGDGLVSQVLTIAMAAGENVRRELQVVRGTPFGIDVQLPTGEPSGTVTIRGPDGIVGFTEQLTHDDRLGTRRAPSLALGRNDAVLVGANGNRYVASFVVTEQLRAKDEPLRLRWVREH